MTTQLEKAIGRAKGLPEDHQNHLAQVIIDVIEGVEKWDEAFAVTTPKQLKKMAAQAEVDVENGNISPLTADDFLSA